MKKIQNNKKVIFLRISQIPISILNLIYETNPHQKCANKRRKNLAISDLTAQKDKKINRIQIKAPPKKKIL
jgi:hypothetical protein